MITAGLVLVGLAALIHVYIFVLESLRWTAPSTRKTFRVASAEDAETMRMLAFNQGFYNLFLALAVIVGIVFFALGERAVGATAVFVGAGSMVLASIVLLVSGGEGRATIVQGLAPLLGIVALAAGLLS